MESRPTFCIFCDDIREEAYGKVALMGIYGDDLIVAAFPHQAPKFCISVYVISPIEDPPKSLRICVTYPAGTTLFDQVAGGDLPSPAASGAATKRNHLVRLAFSPMQFDVPGDLEVFVETERETARAGVLKIRAAETP